VILFGRLKVTASFWSIFLQQIQKLYLHCLVQELKSLKIGPQGVKRRVLLCNKQNALVCLKIKFAKKFWKHQTNRAVFEP
jgi:hypothetical protein